MEGDLGAQAIINRLQTTYSRQQDADCKTQTHRDAETQDEAKPLAAWWPPQGGPADIYIYIYIYMARECAAAPGENRVSLRKLNFSLRNSQ